jgi:hypothetical protein
MTETEDGYPCRLCDGVGSISDSQGGQWVCPKCLGLGLYKPLK